MATLNRIFSFASVIVLLCTVNCQVSFQGCCDVKTMDAGQQVAIDIGQALTAGTYRGLSVRFCSADRVYIQIWNMINPTTVQLKWQASFTPAQPLTTNYSTINLALSPITITDTDRLGIYMWESNLTKTAVPYTIDALNGAMYLTQSRFNNASAFTTGMQTGLGSTSQRRTFSPFVKFCTNADCSDLPITTQVQVSQTSTLPYCACPSTCSPDSSITNQLNQQNLHIQYLLDVINKLNQDIINLLSSRVETGTCPPGTISGTYGLGSCYAVINATMGANEAAMYCAITWPESKLVDIFSSVEQMFMYNLLYNHTLGTPGVYSYFTSGIYSYRLNNYVWGQTDIGIENSLILSTGYVAFAQNNAGAPTSVRDSCVIVTIETSNQIIYWERSNCFTPRNFVCKMPKFCK